VIQRRIGLIGALLLGLLTGPLPAVPLQRYDGAETERQWRRFVTAPPQPAVPDRFPFADCFRQSAERYDLPQALLLAVARGESNFDQRARSSADAYGVMQILWPQTARHLGVDDRHSLLDPCINIDAGARYLRELLGRYDGDLHRALAAYNYGPARVPVDGGAIPAGAAWYSGYILSHLDAVLHGSGVAKGRLRLIRFSRPYRAAAYVAAVQPLLGDLRVDWFERPQGGFEVVLSYRDGKQLRRARAALRAIGIEPG
jgi:hypothetical protein